MTLGWELLDSPAYGNAHAEAWEICAKAHKGLQARGAVIGRFRITNGD
jgi:hypothetical protein